MRSSFVRKLVYMGLALLLYLVILAVRAPIQGIRSTHSLSAATLGDVDPTSSTMVLVLGGLRGIASNVLWSKALDMQRDQDWTNLEVVVKSIVKLEPHFISIWTFQSWNLAYNVSVEWDQVEDKYYWVKQGIKFVRRGTEINEKSPELRHDTGWYYFHKIGKCDENVLMRKLFRTDDKPEIDADGHEHEAFNAEGLDNYQVSIKWFQRAVQKCDELDVRPKRMGEVPFRSYPSHGQTDFALSREEDGIFGEVIQRDWLDALKLWTDYADHEFQFTEGKKVKLDYSPEIYGDLYRAVTAYTRSQSLVVGLTKDWEKSEPRELFEYAKLAWPELAFTELEKQSPGERAARKEGWARDLLELVKRDTPKMLADFGQPTIAILPSSAGEAVNAMRTSFEKVAILDPAELDASGSAGDSARRQLAEFATPSEILGKASDEELYWCDRYATMVNYRYWKERCVAESEIDTITARRHFFTGIERFKAGDPEAAKTEFEQGLDMWKKVLDKFARVRDDDLTAEETVKIVRLYLAVRQQLDEPELPPDQIPFQDYIKRMTPQMPTPEEYERMMKEQREDRKNQPGMDNMKKKMIMEKVKAQPQTETPVNP